MRIFRRVSDCIYRGVLKGTSSKYPTLSEGGGRIRVRESDVEMDNLRLIEESYG